MEGNLDFVRENEPSSLTEAGDFVSPETKHSILNPQRIGDLGLLYPFFFP